MTAVDLSSPTVLPDMPEREYHAHPALSSHGAREILRSPRHYQHSRSHPVFRDVFDFGSAAHTMILGVGPQIDVIDASSWRTKEATSARAAARELGRTPVLAADYERILGMQKAVEQHAAASELLADLGLVESSLFWTDPETGAPCKARPDAMSDDCLTIIDVKTSENAAPGAFRASAARFGYPQQAAWYLDAAAAVLGAAEARFVWLVVEKTEPYAVATYEADQIDLATGHELNLRARQKYVDAVRDDAWPGYPERIEPLRMPRWYGND